jgi:hypothetical protein
MKAWPKVALWELLQRSDESTVIDSVLTVIEVPTLPLAIRQTLNRPQAEVVAFKAKHNAIREANAAFLPATLERVFSEGH